MHAIGVAREQAVQPFRELSSISEIQQWLRERAAASPEGTWITTPRVDVTRIRERRFPTRAELDAAAPKHPVVFSWQYASRQIQIINTAALRAAKITRDTPDPTGGKIVKYATGEPTGVLEDPRGLLAKFLVATPPSPEAVLDVLTQVHRAYNEVGITSISERRTNADGWRTYQKLKEQGRLSVRATLTIGLGGDGSVEGSEKFIGSLPFKFSDGDDWVRIGPLKIGVDGGVLYGTAYLREPWGTQAAALYGITDPSYRGTLQNTPEKIRNMIRTGHRLGWQMSSHVTGDAGVDVVLDAVEAANAESPITGRRYTLIHAYFPTADAVRRAAALGVCVDTQPAWYYKDAEAIVTALGESRLKNFIGVADWLRGGVKVALNTDHMSGLDPNHSLNPFNPFLTMGTAVTRKTEGGRIIGPEQRISREDALRMMTIDAAWLSFDEKRKGSIEIGKLADLAVLSDDFMTCEADRIKDIHVLETVLGGKVVYEREP
ncbi:MAG: amidohydrolase [Verrucomicrobiota bacterium]|nr:amidohydrolase [Verrucomicrobiota bacterium]